MLRCAEGVFSGWGAIYNLNRSTGNIEINFISKETPPLSGIFDADCLNVFYRGFEIDDKCTTYNIYHARCNGLGFEHVNEFDVSRVVTSGSIPPVLIVFVAGLKYSLSIN